MMECDLSGFFERVNGIYVMKDRDGRVFPVLFCPFCGVKVDYDLEEKEEKE